MKKKWRGRTYGREVYRGEEIARNGKTKKVVKDNG